MSSEGYHESALSEDTRDLHRAISSLMEELEAVDWYQQRVDATGDQELAAILGHNRDEEIEHAMMVLEWIRRKNPTFAEHAKTYLFTEGPITEVEAKMKAAQSGEADAGGKPEGGAEPSPKLRDESGALGIGSLRRVSGGGK